ncbi:MAG: hypothetical protein GY903_30355 [Fuerstiella sp.]|nr:hypothetical protein [Fuerstiella sp.]MCP4858797.1 hypothetical protein [Fuerstiella sp.]
MKRLILQHHIRAPHLLVAVAWLLPALLLTANVLGGEILLVQSRTDVPYRVPRPVADQQAVPTGTAVYFELAVMETADDDVVQADSVTVRLQPERQPAVAVLDKGIQFAPNYHGFVRPGKDRKYAQKLCVYLDPGGQLLPKTTYTIQIAARSRDGARLAADVGSWQFTTASRATVHPVDFSIDLEAPTVNWQGGFFTGFCGVTFGGNHTNRFETYELMDQVRRTSPKAWSLQRDFWLTGMENQPGMMGSLPNIVREWETRRIVSLESRANEAVLTVEDFFGHEQYGITSNRPLSGDYHPGDEVLVADRVSDARAKVVRIDDDAKTVTLTPLETPDAGWKLAYSGSLPEAPRPGVPGLFAPGGTYLRKFSPAGRPAYYWGRLDHAWDLAHGRFGRRIIVNFTDAPGDISIDGRNWTTAKDYAQLHEVVRTISGHIIDRYGEATLDFPWSILNEPNLGSHFWRSDWTELQKFYDYSTDAILRAFEDRGYDSDKVFIGGLELAGAVKAESKFRMFLAHCSPTANVKGTLLKNAAYADPRLDGKRSKRVEALCGAHDGQGSPCDFVSVHCYRTSEIMARRMAWAKELALEIDSEYYKELWVNSYEACPGWQPRPDPAFGDSYLGNGYFVSWCADVARRQLSRAAEDPRFGFGESILTYWPSPNQNFGGVNDFVQKIQIDDDGDTRADRSVTIATPVLHMLGLLAQLGDDYHVLPAQTVQGQVVSGIASRSGDTVRVLLYAHDGLDTQCRSNAQLDVTLTLGNCDLASATATEYRFDKDHNSYFRLGSSLRDAPDAAGAEPDAKALEELQSTIDLLHADSVETQITGLRRLGELGPAAKSALGSIFECMKGAEDPRIQTEAIGAIMQINLPKAFPAEVIEEVEQLSHMRPTGSTQCKIDSSGQLELNAQIGAGGVNFLVIEPASAP